MRPPLSFRRRRAIIGDRFTPPPGVSIIADAELAIYAIIYAASAPPLSAMMIRRFHIDTVTLPMLIIFHYAVFAYASIEFFADADADR